MKTRLSADELARWKEIPTAVIADEQEHKGIVDPGVRSLFARRFAGQAITIRTVATANPAAHWAISLVQPGDVIAIDGRAYPDSAIWGGNMIAAAAAKGLGALIVDGNVRDGEDLRDSGVAVHARRVQAVGWHWGGDVDVPIECGGAAISPGDLLVGDGDGVAVIKLENREDLMARCLKRIAADEVFQRKMREGMSSIDVLKLPPFPKDSK